MAIAEMIAVPLRELWRHEERDLSPWLAANLRPLGAAVGMPLVYVRREHRVGPFEADIVATDGKGRTVLIENQLEATNHDHLGKLVTYAANLDAAVAIWIAGAPRPEHARGVRWLNACTLPGYDFYLVKLEAFRIGKSAPAPRFTVIVAPEHSRPRLVPPPPAHVSFWRRLGRRTS